MSGNTHIAAIGPEEAPTDTQTGVPGDTEAVPVLDEQWQEEDAPVRRRFGWVVPALALSAILGWSGFFFFSHRADMLGGASLLQWSSWITAWSIPVILVIGLWLLAMRSSSREAARFANVASLLSQESARLEERLVTVNRELSLAREFIAAQSRDLDSLGRVASERLSESADRMAGLIHSNSEQIESIATVSSTALENMDKLRGDLPVIANSARDVTSQIGNAGRTAQGQLEELVSGFHRLNEFGEASERQVEALRIKVDGVMAAFESQSSRLEEQEASSLAALSERLAALQTEADSFAASMRAGEEEALEKWTGAVAGMRESLAEAAAEVARIEEAAHEEARERLAAIGEEAQSLEESLAQRAEAFMEGAAARRNAQQEHEAQAAAELEARLADLDTTVARHQEQQLAHVEALAQRGDTLAARLSDLNGQLEAIAAQGSTAGEELYEAADRLGGKLAANREILQSTEQTLTGMTDASVRLLELIQAGAAHSREQLPEAIEAAQQNLAEFEERAKSIGLVMGEAGEKGRELSEYVLSAEREGKAAMAEIEAFQTRVAQTNDSQAERIESLRISLSELAEESEGVSLKAQGELTEAVERLNGALRNALDDLKSSTGTTIEGLAESISEQSAEAIDKAIRFRTSEAIGELEQAAAHASGVSREAARQLRDQLAKVDELAGNLETRVTRARERAEERVDNDFARRAALITESLNSNAIDISKALSNDVTDTAWASYLRGDRGIFTRRAVRLLENPEAREIAEIYDEDGDFREHVSRYIHDFEGMLRSMLSTRDGNALGVTLLSSDMGKLYVALAQAIERLRD